MTYEELCAIPQNSPVMLVDGAFGLLIRYWRDVAGVQVLGEATIRRIPLDRIVDRGGGALAELPVASAALE